MRNLLPFVLTALLFAAACAGSSAPLDTTNPLPDQQVLAPTGGSLADLPGPREVSVGDSVIDVSGSSRSFLLTTAVYLSPGEPGIHQDNPDFMLVFDPSTDDQLTHTFFPLFGPLDDQSVTLSQVSLDLEWHGDMPTGEMGMYVGVPDYTHNRWVWGGPARTTADIMDFSAEALSGNPKEFAFDKLALVNYSGTEVKLRYIGLTTTKPGDVTGDEMLFFITNDGGSYAINYTTTGNLDASMPIFEGGPGVELANLHVIHRDSDPLLVFDRRADGGKWQVWQSTLDGSQVRQRYAGAGDMRFVATTPDAEHEFMVTGDGAGLYTHVADHLTGNQTPETVFDLPSGMDSGGFWYGNTTLPNISIVSSGMDENGQSTVMYFGWSDYLQQMYYLPFVYLQEGESAIDPFYFKWNDSESFSTPTITLYSYSADGDDTNEIRASFLGLPFDQNNRTYLGDDSYSLRYPSVSPGSLYLSVVACQPGMDYGELFVQSSFLRTLDETAGIAANVTGTPAWYDPTPPVFETN